MGLGACLALVLRACLRWPQLHGTDYILGIF